MARKEFHFDFNEEADPVEELHRLRVAAAKHFKTSLDISGLFTQGRTVEEAIADAHDAAKALAESRTIMARETARSARAVKLGAANPLKRQLVKT